MSEKFTFKTEESKLVSRNGQSVIIREHITEPSAKFDAEVLPMMRIEFEDGYVTECWPDELTPQGDAYCPESPDHRHQVTDGSCDQCGAKNFN